MYKKQKHIHFIGIGGIGMSGIATIIKQLGYTVSGCDTAPQSKVTTHLKKIGCTIHQEHTASHILDADILVYSSAVKPDNEELKAALEKGIPVISRGIMLAELMRTKYGIAIAGAHGKTTTTSMISHILIEAKLDPTVIVGGILKNLSANTQLGSGNWLIAESDESDKSFLYLNPTIAVVTNIDAEHLDMYKDLDEIKQTFKDFLSRLPFYGKAILCYDDPHIQSILPLPHIPTIKYGLHEDADIRGEIISMKKDSVEFAVYEKKHSIKPIPLNAAEKNAYSTLLGNIILHMPGRHNVSNALAAISLCHELDIPFAQIQSALENFKGIERRFEYKGTTNGAEIFDDYGHHPTEIANTLLIARQRAVNKLHVIFQPHRYTRTEKLWNDFVSTLADFPIDVLYLADIYPASEQPIDTITSQRLAQDIQTRNPHMRVLYLDSYEAITHVAKDNLAPHDLLITIGAGKIYKVGEQLLD